MQAAAASSLVSLPQMRSGLNQDQKQLYDNLNLLYQEIGKYTNEKDIKTLLNVALDETNCKKLYSIMHKVAAKVRVIPKNDPAYGEHAFCNMLHPDRGIIPLDLKQKAIVQLALKRHVIEEKKEKTEHTSSDTQSGSFIGNILDRFIKK